MTICYFVSESKNSNDLLGGIRHIMDIIEYLRRKMIHTAEAKGSLTHPEVVAISHQLDRFLVQVQRHRPVVRTFVNSRVSRQDRKGIKITKPTSAKVFMNYHSMLRHYRESRNSWPAVSTCSMWMPQPHDKLTHNRKHHRSSTVLFHIAHKNSIRPLHILLGFINVQRSNKDL